MITDQSNKHLTCLMTGQKVLFLQDPQSPQGKAEGNVDGREETKYKCFVIPTNSCNSKFRLFPEGNNQNIEWVLTNGSWHDLLRSEKIFELGGLTTAFYTQCRLGNLLFVYYLITRPCQEPNDILLVTDEYGMWLNVYNKLRIPFKQTWCFFLSKAERKVLKFCFFQVGRHQTRKYLAFRIRYVQAFNSL